MTKILVGLYVPSLQVGYDLLVPKTLQICELIQLIVSGVVNSTNGAYKPSGKELLCLRQTKTLFKADCTLTDYGICDGDQLLLY